MIPVIRIIGTCSRSSLTCLIRPAAPLRCSRSLCSSVVFRSELPMSVPTPEGANKVYPPHIENLVTEISQLSLLEVADLTILLKQRLNIPDAAPVAFAAPGQGIATAQEDEEEETQVKVVQTSFAVRLTGFEPTKKIALIKYIKGCVEGFNLVQSKKFVEDLPAIVKSDLGKDEAMKMKDELIAVGAEAAIE